MNKNQVTKLEEFKLTKYLTKKIFSRLSENIHYELFKYLTAEELLVIREVNNGGFQLTSNKLLRSRIKNYFYILHPEFSENSPDMEIQIKLILEWTGKNVLCLAGMKLREKQINELSYAIRQIPYIEEFNLGRLFMYIIQVIDN